MACRKKIIKRHSFDTILTGAGGSKVTRSLRREGGRRGGKKVAENGWWEKRVEKEVTEKEKRRGK